MRTKVQEYPGKKRKLPVRLLFGILGAVLVLVLTTLALSPILANTVQIRSGAMSPTISISDTVCVNHLAYLLLPPSRGDIIQFRTSAADETAFQAENPLSIRRIIALPGETVQITDGKVYINGSPLAEDYLSGELTKLFRELSSKSIARNKSLTRKHALGSIQTSRMSSTSSLHLNSLKLHTRASTSRASTSSSQL